MRLTCSLSILRLRALLYNCVLHREVKAIQDGYNSSDVVLLVVVLGSTEAEVLSNESIVRSPSEVPRDLSGCRDRLVEKIVVDLARRADDEVRNEREEDLGQQVRVLECSLVAEVGQPVEGSNSTVDLDVVNVDKEAGLRVTAREQWLHLLHERNVVARVDRRGENAE